MLASPFHVGEPLHLKGPIFATKLARQYREHTMVGTVTPIYYHKEPIPIRGIRVTYRACPARACWRKYGRSVAYSAEYFLGAIGTCLGT